MPKFVNVAKTNTGVSPTPPRYINIELIEMVVVGVMNVPDGAVPPDACRQADRVVFTMTDGCTYYADETVSMTEFLRRCKEDVIIL